MRRTSARIIGVNRPNWEVSTDRVNVQIIEDHLIAKLGSRPVRDLSDPELQRFINVSSRTSQAGRYLANSCCSCAPSSKWPLTEGSFSGILHESAVPYGSARDAQALSARDLQRK